MLQHEGSCNWNFNDTWPSLPFELTIYRQSRDWTRTIFLRGNDEDYTLSTRARILERIRVTLAGRAAEDMLLQGGASTYSATDLKARTSTLESLTDSVGTLWLHAPPAFGTRIP